jgi:hypothetical protein
MGNADNAKLKSNAVVCLLAPACASLFVCSVLYPCAAVFSQALQHGYQLWLGTRKSQWDWTFETFLFVIGPYRSWRSSVSTVYYYRLDDRGSIPGRGIGFFSLGSVSRPDLRPTQSPIQRVLGFILGGKAWPGRDTDHSPHLVPRSRMSRSYTSSLPWRLNDGRGSVSKCEWKLL